MSVSQFDTLYLPVRRHTRHRYGPIRRGACPTENVTLENASAIDSCNDQPPTNSVEASGLLDNNCLAIQRSQWEELEILHARDIMKTKKGKHWSAKFTRRWGSR